jgi:mevalonate kinase
LFTVKTGAIKKEFYGHGKILLTGEYAVLDGAKALALPTKMGQSMLVKSIKGSDLVWESYNGNGEKWFSSQLTLLDFSPVKTNNEEVSEILEKLLKNAVRLNSDFLSKWNGFKVTTKLEFDRHWGLGSSSTLTYLIAEWAEVNPLLLHFKTFEGSGYDVACAGSDGPIEYQATDDEVNYTPVDFSPTFTKNMYFVYTGNKTSSAIAIRDYFKKVKARKQFAKKINQVSEDIISAKSFTKFCEGLEKHEDIVSEALGMPKIKDERFPDFWGTIKSLGAWGGDFILACSSESEAKTKQYFADKACNVFFPYHSFILE